MDLSPPIPILRIFSEEAARSFYLDFLGFKIDWEHRFEPGMPIYAQISRGRMVLHLSEHFGDATPGSTVFVPMTGIDAYQAELLARHYKYSRPHIDQMDWGRQMQIADPFGNRLRFCEQSA
ncbi:glyoxalase superfamily protein [Pseudoduganella sp. GCM10020061]|uniref:glyoxalase superfamily protein n=1 Tax=Pseudoduganella sp. GCM10020061 TaxID=3317345 RepID=UPI00363E3E9E